MTARRPLALLLLALSACAAGRAGLPAGGVGPSGELRAALEAFVTGADPGGAAARLQAAAARAPRDPWARLGAALAARRSLDAAGELEQLVALVGAAPDHPLALAALRRLGELPEGSPELARAVEAGVAPLSTSGRLAGLAAFRARVARIAAAEAVNDVELVARLRAENGSVSGWTLAGPFGALHALDFDRPFAPEQGSLPAEVPGVLLGPPRPTRPLPVPDGMVTFEGEPADGDVHFLAAEVTAARGGRYLAITGASGSVRAWLDGAPLGERRAFAGQPPGQSVHPVELGAGPHRLLLEATRGGTRAALIVSLVRADGAPSDLSSRPLPAGPLPPVATGPWPASAFDAAGLARALEPGGLALSRLLAARDAETGDLEAAKALLEEGLRRHPASAALRAARGAVHAADPTLDEQAARSRAEAALRGALGADPGDAEARLQLAELLRKSDRPADADALLDAMPEDAARRPAALALRAWVAEDRGLTESAEALAEAARAAGGSCEATRRLADLAGRRDSVARQDELERALLGCRGGRERLAHHLAGRGDPAGALELLAPLARVRPTAVAPAMLRAGAIAALGDPAAAARSLEPLLAAWPRSAGLMKTVADAREQAGDAAGARALRERALRQDGADLTLRRALALEDGGEPLAGDAIDALAAIREYRAAPRREDASSAMVLDAAAIALHPGGSATERVHQVIRVLDQEAVDRFGEVQVPPGAQRLALRTVKPDGRVLEPEDGEGKGAASLSGLEPGDFVDLEYLRGTHPGRPGDGVVADAFYFATPGSSMFRSTYVVRAPRGLGLVADAHGMAPVPVAVEGDEEVVRAERTLVPALIPEPSSPPAPELVPFVSVGAGGGRESVQLALADAVADRTGPTLELRAAAEAVRAAAGKGAGPEAICRAAYARVRELVVGQGGGLGEDASAVLSRGRGSRLVLLKALLDELGLTARFAAVRPFGADQTDYRFPSAGLWSQAVLRVELPGGAALWLDPALRQQPFGALPERSLDAEALLLPAPGEPPRVVRTPAESGRREGRALDVRIRLGAGGEAEVEGEDRFDGSLGAGAKAALERLDQTARRQAVEQLLGRSFRGLSLADLRIEGEEDPEAPLVIRWKGTVPALARDAGVEVLVEAPILASRLGARYVQRAERTTPLLLDAPEHATTRLTVTPPPGLAPRAGAPERLETPYGLFTRSERVEGGALVREERLEVARGRIQPAQYPAFAAFAGGVDQIQARPVAFSR